MDASRSAGSGAWPEGARRYVKALKAVARCYRSERDHYAAMVAEREYDWDTEDSLRDQVEALGIENYKLKTQCAALQAWAESQAREARARGVMAPEARGLA